MNFTQARSNVDDLAAYILKCLGTIDTLKLQKLLYYCQGWSLAFRQRALFNNRIEAWKHGPVVRDIYGKHRKQVFVSAWPWGNADALTAEDKSLVESVVQVYGARDGWALREATHKEAPWIDAWNRSQQGCLSSNEEIPQEDLYAYFRPSVEQTKD